MQYEIIDPDATSQDLLARATSLPGLLDATLDLMLKAGWALAVSTIVKSDEYYIDALGRVAGPSSIARTRLDDPVLVLMPPTKTPMQKWHERRPRRPRLSEFNRNNEYVVATLQWEETFDEWIAEMPDGRV